MAQTGIIIPTRTDTDKLRVMWEWFHSGRGRYRRNTPAGPVWEFPDAMGKIPGEGETTWEPLTFFARITAATKDGANDRYIYDFVEVEKKAGGYDQWQDVTGGRTGTAALYDLPEDQGGAGQLAVGTRVKVEIIPVWSNSLSDPSEEYWIVGTALTVSSSGPTALRHVWIHRTDSAATSVTIDNTEDWRHTTGISWGRVAIDLDRLQHGAAYGYAISVPGFFRGIGSPWGTNPSLAQCPSFYSAAFLLEIDAATGNLVYSVTGTPSQPVLVDMHAIIFGRTGTADGDYPAP